MKTNSLLLLAASLTCSVALAADPGYTPMKIIQTEPVNYPRRASDLGLTEGDARVAVQIDETGKLTDYLVIGYTHPSFAQNAVYALKKWRFEPATIGGVPRGATVDLSFNFETHGIIVVDLTVSSYVELRNQQLRPSASSYSACRLSQLDRIPTPAKVIRPAYPLEASQKGQGAVVTIHFYIDEQGHVRLPAASRESTEEHEAFAAAALQAVSQWEFEPPMSRGRPVLVAARQDFNFTPNAAPVAVQTKP